MKDSFQKAMGVKKSKKTKKDNKSKKTKKDKKEKKAGFQSLLNKLCGKKGASSSSAASSSSSSGKHSPCTGAGGGPARDHDVLARLRVPVPSRRRAAQRRVGSHPVGTPR